VNEIVFIREIGLTILVFLSVGLAIAGIYRLLRNPKEHLIRKEYEERIEALNKQIKTLEDLLKAKELAHKEELRRYSKINKMLHELRAALSQGAVKLTCPKHKDAEVTVLADGTIVCSEGHRLWPVEVKKREKA